MRVRLSRADEDIGPYENFGRNCVGAAVHSRPHGMNCGPMGAMRAGENICPTET